MNSGDTAWVLISTALVILMTPALGFFYAGMVRKKNVLSTLMLSVVMLALITVQWILYGYSISFGTDHAGIIGGLNWIGLNGVGGAPHLGYAPTIPHLLFMFFQLAFAVITPALITGAFVERIKFPSFLLFSLLWATFIYAPVAHWVWGIGGWLRAMGALDFAGGIVVHITAGISALAVALVIGKRKGYGKTPMEPSNIPLTVLGAFLLWFGWFGFNGGSALSASSIAVSAVVATNAAGASAALTWMLLNWMHKRPSLLGFSTGAIVGLAAVTPASGFISPLSALIIGVVAATLSYYMIIFRLKVGLDESLDVFACHGIGGIWGTLALGLFAQKAINVAGNDGLFFGNPGFFGIQIFAVLIVVIFSFVGTYFLAKVVDTLFSLRAKESEEDVGMDLAYHGETTY
ncbi:ammonia channel protein [candidate division WOR-1 bacterium RIFOXYC2_FULL_37_10]|nr:MAG: ammonia channel protein [candidate division WOR-1 bacterium RIFOXYA2_FULL_37_7]OGC33328.1 MAG: ammonia channel protein [candidate division WOR-1 bacterium RIFOXYC2_FULL_37_10]